MSWNLHLMHVTILLQIYNSRWQIYSDLWQFYYLTCNTPELEKIVITTVVNKFSDIKGSFNAYLK